MNMPFSIKVPFDVVVKMKEKLALLAEINNKEIQKAEAKAGSAPTPANQKALAALIDRRRRLTPHYLLRACLVAGLGTLDKKPEDLLKLMDEDTVRVGRPSDGERAA